jgi:uncharacterized protein YndB with AHSA1/START domain
MTNSSALSLEVDQMIDARPETVFRLLTDPGLYARWFGPEGSEVTVEEMEVTLGGRLALRIAFPGMDFEVGIEGFYEVIEPPLRLVHTWRATDEELITTVSFELEPRGEATNLRVNHRGFVDPVDLEQNRGGWVDHLGTLGQLALEIESARP